MCCRLCVTIKVDAVGGGQNFMHKKHLFVFILSITFLCTGCFDAPVKTGPLVGHPGGNTVVSHEKNSSGSIERSAGSSSVSIENTDDNRGKNSIKWDKKLIARIPAGFICFGALKTIPEFVSDHRSFSQMTDVISGVSTFSGSKEMSSIIALILRKAASCSVKNPFVFAVMPSDSSKDESMRFILLTPRSGSFEKLLKESPISNTFVSTGEDYLAIGSDIDVIEGVKSVVKGKIRSMEKVELSVSFRKYLKEKSDGYIYCDYAALTGKTPAFSVTSESPGSVTPGSVTPGSATSGSTTSGSAGSNIKGALFQWIRQDDQSVEISGIVLKSAANDSLHSTFIDSLSLPGSSSIRDFPALVSHQISGETIDALIALSFDENKIGSDKESILSLLPLSIYSTARALVDRTSSAMVKAGIKFDEDVKPYIKSEIAVVGSWKLRYPQFALMIKISDPEKWSKNMTAILSYLKGTGYVFATRETGGHPVYYTREQSILSEIFEPAFVITPRFLFIASGRHVLESILLGSEKLEGTRVFLKSSRKMKGKFHNLFYLNSHVLGRLIDSGSERLRQYEGAAIDSPDVHRLKNSIEMVSKVYSVFDSILLSSLSVEPEIIKVSFILSARSNDGQ